MKQPCVYILSNQVRGTLYIGVTSNLLQRVWQHKQNLVDGFSKQYGLHILVYFEQFDDMLNAIVREKQLKKWNRAWKVELIESINSDWRDLYLDLIDSQS
ncbi:MAG TPA: GIY-YIG nuclease family protein [Methylophilaceae bacterium]|jgi:putative endonuclease